MQSIDTMQSIDAMQSMDALQPEARRPVSAPGIQRDAVPAEQRRDAELLRLMTAGEARACAEAEAVESHLATCAACRPPLARWRGDLAALAESVEPQAPPPAGLLEAGEGSLVVEGVGATDEEVWAVTEEPRGGVEAPTGEMVFSS